MTAQHTVPPALHGRSRSAWPRWVSAVSAVVLAATMSACEDHSPVAAPTPSIVAPTSPEPSPTATVPEYTTDLDLNAEEKAAVEQALVALDRYYIAMTAAYSGEAEALDTFRQFASGNALDSTLKEVQNLAKKTPSFSGVISPDSIRVYKTRQDKTSKVLTEVIAHSCLDTTKWHFAKGSHGENSSTQYITMENRIIFNSRFWKIDDQQLWSRSC